MVESVSLYGDPQVLMGWLFQITTDTRTDPLYHISEIVQNEIDAGATTIDVELIRQKGKKGKLQKIMITGNGFGFMESFEHYSQHIGDSIKNYFEEYKSRKSKGLSRGEFCLGLQGFRAICEEIHIVNITQPGKKPKTVGDAVIDDSDFDKMFTCRKMVLKVGELEADILNEGDFPDTREMHGVTCSLMYPTVEINTKNLVKYLAQNKRAFLQSNKNLKITVIDGTFQKLIEPMSFKGDLVELKIEHPKASKNVKYRGLGELYAKLYLHVEKTGSYVGIHVENEPIHTDITVLDEFKKSPWDSGCVEGFIEYGRLTKSPTRAGVIRDKFFWPAFLEMMDVLERKVNKEIKKYLEKTKTEQHKQTMKRINQVMGDVRRELEFTTWYNKKIDITRPGPLDSIKLFPETINVPAYTTRRIQVKAYDSQGKELKEKDSIKFEWEAPEEFGKIMPKKDGVAILKSSSRKGVTTIKTVVTDLITLNQLHGSIQIVVTHPPTIGTIERVIIDPGVWTLPLGDEKLFQAIAQDEDRNEIEKGVKFYWMILDDDTNGASLSTDYSESVILTPGKNTGMIKIQVTAKQFSKQVSDYALITVTEREEKKERKPKLKDTGLPDPEEYHDPNEFPLRHSYLSNDGMILYYNTGHPDYKNADNRGKKYRQRYMITLYGKELAKKEYEATRQDYGELLLDVLSKIDRFW